MAVYILDLCESRGGYNLVSLALEGYGEFGIRTVTASSTAMPMYYCIVHFDCINK